MNIWRPCSRRRPLLLQRLRRLLHNRAAIQSVARSTRNVAQKSGDKPGAIVDITEKRENSENEMSGPGSETISPATLNVPIEEERSPAEKEGGEWGRIYT